MAHVRRANIKGTAAEVETRETGYSATGESIATRRMAGGGYSDPLDKDNLSDYSSIDLAVRKTLKDIAHAERRLAVERDPERVRRFIETLASKKRTLDRLRREQQGARR